MIIEEEGVREAQAEGSIYIHGSERGSLIRSSLDARIIPMDPTLSEWLQKILFTISSKQASKRTLTGLAEAFAEHNIDPAVAEKESGRFFRELSSLGSIQVCFDFTRSEGGLPEIQASLLMAMNALADGIQPVFGVAPIIRILPQNDWESPRASTAIEMAASTGNPVFSSNPPSGTIVAAAVTLNLPHIALAAKNESTYFGKLTEQIRTAEKYLRRRIIEETTTNGPKPAGSICTLGGSEAVRNLVGRGIETNQGKVISYKILEDLRKTLAELAEESGNVYLVEPCPDPAASSALAESDKTLNPNAAYSGANQSYYTQSTRLPTGYTDDLYDVLEHQKKLQSFYDGGETVVVHLAEPIKGGKPAGILIERILGNFGYPSMALGPRFAVCKNGMRVPKASDCGEQADEYGWGWNGMSALRGMSPAEKEEWSLCKPYAVKSK